VPAEWRDGVIIPLYNEKGSKADCSCYRLISLLSVLGKVSGLVLLSRLKPLIVANCRPEQSRFTARKSTADVILTLCLLSEIHYEFPCRPLHRTYVYLKSAFHSVDRSALWLALKTVGTRDILLQLLQDLYTGSGTRIMVGANVSDRFCTTSGVRGGAPGMCVGTGPVLLCG